jgi:thioredoxin-like negative regulator of GroEL
MVRGSLIVIAVAALGCRERPAQERGSGSGSAGSAASAASAACASAKPHGTFRWIEDDYAAALACARARGVPLVLDLWAPWCHTCLSMQSTVFADPALARHAEAFVFVALDTDREVNAEAVARYPLSAWPTFYVVSPDETVLGRFVGAASVAQFDAFLGAGARAMAGGAAGADAHLLAAERALQRKDHAAAERELVAALRDAPPDWPRRPDALVSLIGARYELDDLEGCLALAEQSLDATGRAASVADFSSRALACAEQREEAEPDRVNRVRERVAARLAKLVDDPTAPLAIDDRADAMLYLRTALAALGKDADAEEVANRQLALLDEAAARAPDPMTASTFNWPRAEVYAYLGRPLDLVPALEKSVKDLPDEYDPPSRLGWVLWKGGKLDEAARWTEVALARVYGPRKLRVLNQRIEIALAQKDRAAERKFRGELVKTLEALPASQTSPEAIENARRALAEIPSADGKR